MNFNNDFNNQSFNNQGQPFNNQGQSFNNQGFQHLTFKLSRNASLHLRQHDIFFERQGKNPQQIIIPYTQIKKARKPRFLFIATEFILGLFAGVNAGFSFSELIVLSDVGRYSFHPSRSERNEVIRQINERVAIAKGNNR